MAIPDKQCHHGAYVPFKCVPSCHHSRRNLWPLGSAGYLGTPVWGSSGMLNWELLVQRTSSEASVWPLPTSRGQLWGVDCRLCRPWGSTKIDRLLQVLWKSQFFGFSTSYFSGSLTCGAWIKMGHPLPTDFCNILWKINENQSKSSKSTNFRTQIILRTSLGGRKSCGELRLVFLAGERGVCVDLGTGFPWRFWTTLRVKPC